jgi:hypothetical protein
MNYPGFRNAPNLDGDDLLIFYHEPPQYRPAGAVVFMSIIIDGASPRIFKKSFFMRIKKKLAAPAGFFRCILILIM